MKHPETPNTNNNIMYWSDTLRFYHKKEGWIKGAYFKITVNFFYKDLDGFDYHPKNITKWEYLPRSKSFYPLIKRDQ